MWPAHYEERLLEWAALRAEASKLPLDEALHLIHDWWNTAPIVNNVIHFTDPDNWPLPWDLLAESAYCDVAKCLGICYTILLIQHEEIKSLRMLQTDNYTYVEVNEGKYMLNDQPGEITADLEDLRIRFTFDCDNLKQKIQ